MLFPTVTFALFFLIVLPVSWALMRAPARVARVDPARELRLLRLVGLALRLPARRARPSPTTSSPSRSTARGRSGARRRCSRSRVAFDLGLLGYFKYAGFFLSSAENAQPLGLATSWIATSTLPVGISFYTFMAISYVVDTYRGELVPASFARFAVFQAFFPHLVAGPIVRASELLPQLERPRDPRARRHERGRSS